MEISSKTGFIYRHEALFVFVIGVLILLPRIWCETSITGQDEYWLSFRTPIETMEHGDWFTPWVNGEPRLKKPPLLYWAILWSYKLLGINLFAARIWGVLAGAGLAVCSLLIYRELFKKSGILAGLITLATLTVAIEGRRAMLDLPLTFFTAMALFFAIKWGEIGSSGLDTLIRFFHRAFFPCEGPRGNDPFCDRLFQRPVCVQEMGFFSFKLGTGFLGICLGPGNISTLANNNGLYVAQFPQDY